MAFLCPVRIRSNSSSGARKKKQNGVDPGGKKRSFLSATVNSIIGDHHNEHVSSGVAESNNRGSEGGNSGGSGPGRITGSSSIETLVRVGLEKEAGIQHERCVILHDFAPCVDDELEVKRGSVVSILYRENDWVYVILDQLPNGVPVSDEGGGSREGFIPHSYCAAYGSPLADMALGGGHHDQQRGKGTRSFDNESLRVVPPPGGGQHGVSRHCGGGGGIETGTEPFYKDPSPTRYIALYKFTARDENDVNVERGEILTVLNKDDPEWFYVVRSDGQEGFVPSAFVYPLTHQQDSQSTGQPTYQQIDEHAHEYADAQVQQSCPSPPQQQGSSTNPTSCATTPTTPGGVQVSPDFGNQSHSPPQQQYGTELVMLYDYKAQAPDDLSVRRDDWVYADLLHQTVEGWLWAYAPKQRKYVFIPKAYARPPAMTSL